MVRAADRQRAGRRRHRDQSRRSRALLTRLDINRRRDPDSAGEDNRTPDKGAARCPGRMIHVDVNKVGRIPDGGG